MTKLLQRVEVTLRSFYIFNSNFGKTDGEEHKKIMYYYPDDIEINTKIKDVGLSEAIIAFTSTFTDATNECQTLHTQKTTQVFYQPESDYWMVLVLNVPKEIRTKDGVEVAEYRGGEVHDRIYRALLEQCYDMFRLLHGTFQINLENSLSPTGEGRLHLQQKLTYFYDKYLTSLKLPACDIMEVTRSLQYLPLDKHLFLNAHNFVNTILATYSEIFEAILLYKEHVVCGGKLHPLDLHCLHRHILDEEILLKMPLAEVTANSGGAVLSRSSSTIADCYHNGAFITTSAEKDNEASTTQSHALLPKLYLGREKSLVPYYLIIYRALDALMCLLVKTENGLPQKDFYDELHSCMGQKLTYISRDISASISSSNKQVPVSGLKQVTATLASSAAVSPASDPSAPKYLFINEQSFKHLSNITIDRKRPQLSIGNVPSNVLQLIADLDNEDQLSKTSSATASFNETLLKTTNDFWIVRRCCCWRKYYVIIFNNKSTLLDVTTEALRIFEQEIPDDVFFNK